MQWTDKIRHVRTLLVVAAAVIVAASLVVSHLLVRDLSLQEHRNMEVWAEAMRQLNTADENTDLMLVLKVLNGNDNIPVVVTDSEGNVQDYRNLSIKGRTAADSLDYVRRLADEMRSNGRVVRVDDLEVCYAESLMLRRLAIYPYVQMAVVLLFVIVALMAVLSSKRAEQNRVWVGLSKETAHQLGTPISSLTGWVEVLRETYPEDDLIVEMGKDVKRLELLADRFNKIGSRPELKPENLCDTLDTVVQYMKRRAGQRVSLSLQVPETPIIVPLSASLFEWVIENLCKNAIDAMEARGNIWITAGEGENVAWVEVRDTGKGIALKNFDSVFMPGFTTKARGWGLGLPLARRIVEEYHEGHIFVKQSELGKGTTFRVELKKA
ncbi:MAG: HAMP domain-containing sensor histidine kinase [Bacteroidaceae bacterium]|nr:HAMP domain-containing sensor histidine kinase [Prevotellaceae bacterium]MDY5631268.1 HAMP domain-containing sensor histidine kinase [Bacteroidaceae bacterium]